MLSSLLQSADVSKVPMYLVLVPLAIQPCIVLAQSQNSSSYHYYWLTPGRIVGIVIGGLALIFFFISLLTLVRRRCLHRRSRSTVAPSSSFSSGAVPAGSAARPPPAYPAWIEPPGVQQPIQSTTRGPGSGPGAIPGSGWHYPSSDLYGHPKPIVPSPSNPAEPSAQPGSASSTPLSLPGQGGAPLSRPMPSVQTHEQGQEGSAPLAPPPRHRPSYATRAQGASAGGDESPPPYSLPSDAPATI